MSDARNAGIWRGVGSVGWLREGWDDCMREKRRDHLRLRTSKGWKRVRSRRRRCFSWVRKSGNALWRRNQRCTMLLLFGRFGFGERSGRKRCRLAVLRRRMLSLGVWGDHMQRCVSGRSWSCGGSLCWKRGFGIGGWGDRRGNRSCGCRSWRGKGYLCMC